MKQKTQTIKVEVHPCALKEPCPKQLDIRFNGKSYLFHFYINDVGRYVALCNIVGCSEFHGEGANWWIAAKECMYKILAAQKD